MVSRVLGEIRIFPVGSAPTGVRSSWSFSYVVVWSWLGMLPSVGACPLVAFSVCGPGDGRSDGVGLVALALGDVVPSLVHVVHLKPVVVSSVRCLCFS